MQDSWSPAKIPLPFAATAAGPYINTIPTASQIGITDGAASWTDGFPPLNFVPVSAGGAAPFGQDYNGVLNQISWGVQWQQAGGPIGYDAVFSTAITGYPFGAIIRDSTTGFFTNTFWLSTADNNTSNPDAGGADWRKIIMPAAPFVPVMTLVFFSVLSSVQNFQVPAGITKLFCRMCGGGGAGASSSATASGGGGAAGGHCFGYIDVTPGQVILVTTGAPGITDPTPPAGGSDGGWGGSSSVGAFLAASGGEGGYVVANQAGGDTINPDFTGGNGYNGGQGGDGDSASNLGRGGNGGASYYGGGGRSSTTIAVGNFAPGAGGGGGYFGTGIPGDDGAHGIVEIWGL